jgi:hypothetical protein
VVTVELLKLVTVVVMVAGEATSKHADVTTEAGYLLRIVGATMPRRLRGTIDVFRLACVMVVVTVVGKLNVTVEAVVV